MGSFIIIVLFLVFVFFLSYFLMSWILKKKDPQAPQKPHAPLVPKILNFLADILDYFDKRKFEKEKQAKQAEATNHTANSGNIRYCPYCDSKIPKNATKCWNCKNRLPVRFSRLLASAVVSFVFVFIVLICFGSPSSNSAAPAPSMSRSDYISQCRTISYEKLARNPESYRGDYFKFTGEVIQVVQQGKKVQLRVNVTPETLYDTTYYSDTIFVVASLPDDGNRILENDIITLYGVCDGLYTYTTVLGSSMSIPKISAAYWDVK